MYPAMICRDVPHVDMRSNNVTKRESFGSRLGFILVSAGCAVGIGNVWKFPYVCGQNGGAIFVLLYLFFLVIMGIPVLTMELAIGRASGKTIVQGYKALEKPGSKWHLHGWVCIAGCYLLMMYYTTVSGWMLSYFCKFVNGDFEGVTPETVPAVFDNMLSDPNEMMLFTTVVVVAGFIVLIFGVKNGLETVNKFMMTGLLTLILALVINSGLLEGASEGIKFYLLPNVDSIKQIGFWNVIMAAMSQAFFTLSLGTASMEVFGSYMSRSHTITSESVKIVCLDTIVAITSGLIIFPACFSFGIAPGQGPSLIFVTLPSVFISMQGGRIWGAMFFLFMTFASFSTVTAVFENIVGSAMDNLGWSRRKSVTFNAVFMIIASMPALLGYNVLQNVHFGDRDILDFEDFIVSNILLPVGALVFVVFCSAKFGWGADKYLEETNTGKGIKMSKYLVPYFKFVLPLLILIIIIKGLI